MTALCFLLGFSHFSGIFIISCLFYDVRNPVLFQGLSSRGRTNRVLFCSSKANPFRTFFVGPNPFVIVIKYSDHKLDRLRKLKGRAFTDHDKNIERSVLSMITIGIHVTVEQPSPISIIVHTLAIQPVQK